MSGGARRFAIQANTSDSHQIDSILPQGGKVRTRAVSGGSHPFECLNHSSKRPARQGAGGAGAPSPLRACPASPSRLTDPPRPHPHPRYVPIRPPPAPPCLCRCRNRAASRMMLTVARKVHAPQRTPPCTAPACGPPFADAGEDEDKNQQKKCDCCDDRDVHRKSRGCAQQRTQVIQLITILCLFVRVCLCSCLCVAHRLL